MPQVALPRILRPVTGSLAFEVGGTSLNEALGDLLEQEPSLRVHLFDEGGRLRPHVLCFVDGDSTRLDHRERSISPDSTIVFVQAVSGG